MVARYDEDGMKHDDMLRKVFKICRKLEHGGQVPFQMYEHTHFGGDSIQ